MRAVARLCVEAIASEWDGVAPARQGRIGAGGFENKFKDKITDIVTALK